MPARRHRIRNGPHSTVNSDYFVLPGPHYLFIISVHAVRTRPGAFGVSRPDEVTTRNREPRVAQLTKSQIRTREFVNSLAPGSHPGLLINAHSHPGSPGVIRIRDTRTHRPNARRRGEGGRREREKRIAQRYTISVVGLSPARRWKFGLT